MHFWQNTLYEVLCVIIICLHDVQTDNQKFVHQRSKHKKVQMNAYLF